MERKSFADMGCSVAQCLETVGDSWTMLSAGDAFNGVTRFDDFRENPSMPRNTLRDRLAKLVDSGVLAQVPYSDHPPRYDSCGGQLGHGDVTMLPKASLAQPPASP
jgi:DNA-binding HxlR family transcriptional regulator